MQSERQRGKVHLWMFETKRKDGLRVLRTQNGHKYGSSIHLTIEYFGNLLVENVLLRWVETNKVR